MREPAIRRPVQYQLADERVVTLYSCAHCATIVQREDHYCRQCGRHLEDAIERDGFEAAVAAV